MRSSQLPDTSRYLVIFSRKRAAKQQRATYFIEAYLVNCTWKVRASCVCVRLKVVLVVAARALPLVHLAQRPGLLRLADAVITMVLIVSHFSVDTCSP